MYRCLSFLYGKRKFSKGLTYLLGSSWPHKNAISEKSFSNKYTHIITPSPPCYLRVDIDLFIGIHANSSCHHQDRQVSASCQLKWWHNPNDQRSMSVFNGLRTDICPGPTDGGRLCAWLWAAVVSSVSWIEDINLMKVLLNSMQRNR